LAVKLNPKILMQFYTKVKFIDYFLGIALSDLNRNTEGYLMLWLCNYDRLKKPENISS
jgi:hypothetical protein